MAKKTVGEHSRSTIDGVTGGQNDEAAEIESIIPGSPAAKAGITKGDIIIQFAGKDITTFDSLVNVVAVHAPVKKSLLSFRDEKEIEIELTVGRAGPQIAGSGRRQ